MIQRLPDKRPSEIVTVTFKYARQLGAGVVLAPGASVAVAVRKGADPAPVVIEGAPVVVGNDVLVRVVGGLDGVEYLLSCTADTSTGDRLVLEGVLPVALAR